MSGMKMRIALWIINFHDYAIQRQIGKLYIEFYKIMYSTFYYGENLTVWGKSIIRI